MTIFLGLMGGFVFWGLALLSGFERDGLLFKKDEHGNFIEHPKSPRVVAIITITGIIICGAIGFHIDSQFPSHSTSNSSMTKQEKRLANEAGYVEKDGKWYYQGNGNR